MKLNYSKPAYVTKATDVAAKMLENFRELYRHVRFAMKMIYEKQEYKFLNSARDIAKTLYESWAKIKPSI